MKHYDIVIERGTLIDDCQIDVDGVLIGKVLLCLDGDLKKPLGFPAVYKENGLIKMRISNEQSIQFSDRYPVIGLTKIKVVGKITLESQLHLIGLVLSPNPDKRILSIGEQVSEIRSNERVEPIIKRY